MKRATYGLIILVLVSLAGNAWLLVRQHSLNVQLHTAQSSNSKTNTTLKDQLKSIEQQLSQANSTISSLTQKSNFTAGSRCLTQQLAFAEAGSGGGAAGSYGESFSYQNISKSSCTLSGHPGFLALDKTGHVMPDGPVAVGATGSTGTITLAPSAKAYFLAFWPAHDAVGTENGCVNPSLVLSTPPGNLLPLAVSVSDLGYMCGTPSIGGFSNTNGAV